METITSKDGATIAYNKIGNGPAVILVDGAFCSKDFGPMVKIAPLLAEHFTVYSYDRRGRGKSSDTKPYSIEREIEDIDALITLAGGSAFLFGISSGALLSIHAVSKGLSIPKLALLEPPYFTKEQNKMPLDAASELQTMVDKEDRSGAVTYFLRKVMGVPSFVPFILRLTPNWPKMKANAMSLPYDAAITSSKNFDAITSGAVSITIPTLVIDSTKSPKTLRESVERISKLFKNGKRMSLNGSVHDVPPKILVPVLTEFFNEK